MGLVLLLYFSHISSEWTDEWETSPIRQCHHCRLFLPFFLCFFNETTQSLQLFFQRRFRQCAAMATSSLPSLLFLQRRENVKTISFCLWFYGHVFHRQLLCCVDFVKTKRHEDTCLVTFLPTVKSKDP